MKVGGQLSVSILQCKEMKSQCLIENEIKIYCVI
jgi:hypothetical protein